MVAYPLLRVRKSLFVPATKKTHLILSKKRKNATAAQRQITPIAAKKRLCPRQKEAFHQKKQNISFAA
jgi:hypothetical protein